MADADAGSLGEVEYTEEPEPDPPPPALDWRTAYNMMERHGVEHATVVALSMISEQLDYLIKGTTNG